MEQELACFFAMLWFGFFASVCYHLLVFLRSLFAHARAVVDAEDILFLIGTGFAFFLVVYERNDGILRWYTFAGAGLGCLIYRHTLCIPLENVRKWLLQKCRKTYKIKKKYGSKGQVSVDEGSSPEYKEKRKKKKRS